MTNTEFLKKASHLQGEFKELYNTTELIAIYDDYIQVTAKKFHELETEEGLFHHVSQKLNEGRWHYEAMTRDGVKITAVERKVIEDKK